MSDTNWHAALIDLASDLPRAVTSWLTFESACNRQELFSEYYLAKPIGEYLQANTVGILKSEYDHPVLSSYDAGRNPQIDFVILRNGQNSNICFALEVKWIRRETISQTIPRIYNDILRLRLLVSSISNAQFYFLISGLRDDINRLEDYFDITHKKNIYEIASIDKKIYKDIPERTRLAISENEISSFAIRKLKGYKNPYIKSVILRISGR
ncbi:MAG: hypothetical protein SOZ39_02140 [Desulfovibrio piger]|uniref:hypothetical protein n=1 Tax=Desulfovibrio piger TaxID=901 RepID=UPI002A80D2E7|nr:hypothetical protein [Desulfovibrio piger]MDY3879924.1 hypothetical protein [Desulfovibrio piger]